ncbi:hypothetical protein LIER_19975 [Lithospermum erythrorhizon]|uniref:Reverse transcriptase n=1 Tax=Lithospermum erythrorhizon TaxID=34254 RepID=A0AAV3QMG2_LITER
MPFGLKNARATYQRAMKKIFNDMLHKNVECYVDDLVESSWVSLCEGIKLKLNKQIDAIVAMPEPRNLHELKIL